MRGSPVITGVSSTPVITYGNDVFHGRVIPGRGSGFSFISKTTVFFSRGEVVFSRVVGASAHFELAQGVAMFFFLASLREFFPVGGNFFPSIISSKGCLPWWQDDFP